ncbi:unnamed protein product [Heterobilharzia americana]|nr:unnamed protein product [Heterobilharzia americana]
MPNVAHKLNNLQVKTNKLAEEARQRRETGLQVNVEKSEVMKIPNQQQQKQAPVTINGIDLKEVVSFTYLPRQAATQMRVSKPASEKQYRPSSIKNNRCGDLLQSA